MIKGEAIMSHLSLQTLRPSLYLSVLGAVGYIELNYHELQCLEIALYFLKGKVNKINRINKERPQDVFAELRQHHIHHLSDWLHDSAWREELRFDSKNTVACHVESLEDAKWFALACEWGLNEDTLISYAVDEANFNVDMANMDAHWRHDDESSRGALDHLAADFFRHYCEVAKLGFHLAEKFKRILND